MNTSYTATQMRACGTGCCVLLVYWAPGALFSLRTRCERGERCSLLIWPRDTLDMIAVDCVDVLAASVQQLRDLARAEGRRRRFPDILIFFFLKKKKKKKKNFYREARARLCSLIVMHYGSTEMGATAFGVVDALPDFEGATGYVIPDVDVEVVGEKGEKLGADAKMASCAFARRGRPAFPAREFKRQSRFPATGGFIRAIAAGSRPRDCASTENEQSRGGDPAAIAGIKPPVAEIWIGV